MEARDIMTTSLVTVGPDDTVEATAEVLHSNRVSGAPVVSDGRLVGIVTANDVVRALTGAASGGQKSWLSFLRRSAAEFRRNFGTRVSDIMTSDVVTVAADSALTEIAGILATRNVRRVPVVSDDKLVGVVSRSDILRAMVTLSRSRAVHPSRDDRSVRDRILRTLSAQTDVSVRSVSVIVAAGVVYLWGVAETEDDAEAIRAAAERVAGAENVRNFITPLPRVLRAAL